MASRLIVLLLAGLSVVKAAESPMRGIVLSTHRAGHEWGDPAVIDPTMDVIRKTGATWVATHPYARIGNDGHVGALGRDEAADFDISEVPAHWTRPIEAAHAAGLKIAIKPHLAHWGSSFDWRGAIDFGDDMEAWDRFFDGYESWIVAIAKACRDADGLFIGTELGGTIRFEARWRSIIKHIREVSDVPLSYAANWDRYQDVGFWDALDAIGIQAYFPLSEVERPDRSVIEAAWTTRMKSLHDWAETHDRHVVFAELGYAQRWAAAATPWEGHDLTTDAASFQAMLLEVALQAIEAEPLVDGAFLWKWFPEPRAVGRNFKLATPGGQALLQQVWGSTLPDS